MEHQWKVEQHLHGASGGCIVFTKYKIGDTSDEDRIESMKLTISGDGAVSTISSLERSRRAERFRPVITELWKYPETSCPSGEVRSTHFPPPRHRRSENTSMDKTRNKTRRRGGKPVSERRVAERYTGDAAHSLRSLASENEESLLMQNARNSTEMAKSEHLNSRNKGVATEMCVLSSDSDFELITSCDELEETCDRTEVPSVEFERAAKEHHQQQKGERESSSCSSTEVLDVSSTVINTDTESQIRNISALHRAAAEPQRAVSQTCRIGLRSDLTALGIKGFNHVFTPRQIICIYSNSAVDKAIQMFFFHVEGLASFTGIGIPHSQLLLQTDGAVILKEMKESTWQEVWMESKMEEYKLCLLDSTISSAVYTACGSDHGTGELLSSEEAAEKFGIGVEEMSLSRYARKCQTSSGASPLPPDWIKSFVASLHSQSIDREDNSTTGSVMERDSGELNSSDDHTHVGEADIDLDGHFPEQSGEAISIDQSRAESRVQPLQLTVIIYLDSSNCRYLKGSDTRSSQVEFEVGKESDSGLTKLIDPDSHEPVRAVQDASMDFQISPKVTISFLYLPGKVSQPSKTLRTAVDVHYHLDENTQDQKAFGWYHDQLRVSFRCKEPNRVRRERRGLDAEVLSKHEVRTADRGQSMEKSTSSLQGKGGDCTFFAGNRNVASLQFMKNSRNDTSDGTGVKKNSDARIAATCLIQNFAIRDVGRASELSYLATVFPPLELLNVWDPADRSFLRSSGIMSAVPVQIEGHWIVRDDVSYAADSAEVRGLRFCQYEFSCQRDLILHEVKETTERSPGHKKSTSRRPSANEQVGERQVETMIIQQKLTRNFLINHRFSHMQGLRKPHAYEWDLTGQPNAPCPKPADQLVS
ncbi:hypothetical protein Mapa_016322 [Marchantia paleacea]|nr:hypothetical protein Mapa_016322 [Marchantia paleacea]